MSSSYLLRIKIDRDNAEKISSVLESKPTSTLFYWEIAIEENSENFSESINYFLNLIEKSINKLNTIGVHNEDISIWYLYEYNEQCNMEFHPEDLKRMGSLGITLCISCWKI